MEETKVGLNTKTAQKLTRNVRQTLQKIRTSLFNTSFRYQVQTYRDFRWPQENESYYIVKRLTEGLGKGEIQFSIKQLEKGTENSVQKPPRRIYYDRFIGKRIKDEK